MSVYSMRGEGYRFDFVHRGQRYTSRIYKTKAEAREAEARKREVIKNGQAELATPTDTDFLTLINHWLDFLQSRRSEKHFRENVYLARRWVRHWGQRPCSDITGLMVEAFVVHRAEEVSHYTANKDLRHLRATFNYGLKKGIISNNPTSGIEFFPVEKRMRYIPPVEDIDKVISVADLDTQDYLWTIRETMARVSEVNRLTWEEVNLTDRQVVLYTRKKKGGHLTPRTIHMTEQLHTVLSRRVAQRDPSLPWVFHHTYVSSKTKERKTGPYDYRKRIMASLCRKAGVYHRILVR